MALILSFALAISLSTANVVQEMTPGINIGNTLEAIPTETSWGNPAPTLAYFQGVRAAGFKSIRIPVAYTQYSDSEFKIKPSWMAHVVDVVGMARKAGLVAMVNVHWDGGWLEPTYAQEKAASKKLAAFWRQIATALQNSDDRVLFAGTNEVMVKGDYSQPKPEYAEVQNRFNQVFVDTVRATGGKNTNRLLVVQSFNTNIDSAVKFNAAMPHDSAKHALLMEVHHYAPYNFVLNEKSTIWQWGKNATDPKATDTWGNEDYVDAQFQSVKTTFGDRGVPVILGEYCVALKPNYPGMANYRDDWMRYVTLSAVSHGIIPMVWDTGQLFDRSTGRQKQPELIKIIVQAAHTP